MLCSTQVSGTFYVATHNLGLILLTQYPNSYLIDCYPRHVASVMAGNVVMRSTLGAVFPLFSNGAYLVIFISIHSPYRRNCLIHSLRICQQPFSTISALDRHVVSLEGFLVSCFPFHSYCKSVYISICRDIFPNDRTDIGMAPSSDRGASTRIKNRDTEATMHAVATSHRYPFARGPFVLLEV